MQKCIFWIKKLTQRSKYFTLGALRDYCGETTILHEALLQRICYKVIRLTLYECHRINDKNMDEMVHYIPLANSLRLDIQQLQRMVGTNERVPDISEYLRCQYGGVKNEKSNKD